MINLNLNWVSETIKTLTQWWPVVKSNFQSIQTTYNSHASGTVDKHSAEHINYSGKVPNASNVKQGIDNLKNNYDRHINGSNDKHAAEHITFSSSRSTLPDGNVKSAIEKVDERIESIIQEQSLNPNKDIEVVSSRVSAIYGEFDTLPERLDNTDTILNDINERISEPEYSAPQETTTSIITLNSSVVEGQISDVQVMGNTVNQIIRNGNFADGTTGWSGATQQSISASNNILTITGYGEGIAPQAIQRMNNILSGKRYFVRLYARVTTAYNITAYMGFQVAGSTGVKTKSVSNPVVGQWYELSDIVDTSTFTGELKLLIYHQYKSAEEATGKMMQVKEVMAIDMGSSASDNPLYNLTVDEMRQRFPNWLQYGVVSTESVRLKAEGKNYLKDYDKNVSVNAYSLPGNLFDVPYVVPQYTDMTFKAYNCNIPNNTSIAIKSEDKSATLATISAGTGDKVITFNTGNNKIIWLRFYCGVNSPITYQYAQLENGTTATEYEPYKNGGEAYIDYVGSSLPNGVKDEINVNTGELTKRVSDNVSISGTTYAILDTATYTNVDVIKTTAFSNAAAGSTIKDGMTRYCDKNGIELTEIAQADIDNVASVGKYYWHTDKTLWIIVAKGAYADITAARTGLGTTTLNYQLANPVSIEQPAQSLTAYPNGHLIIEPVVRVTKPYNNGITVDKPIQAIESITKVEDGVRTPVDVSKATVASDKKSLTIAGASNNEIYEIIYQYPSELTTLPTIHYRYPLNTAAAIDANTKASAANSKAISDFIAYQNAVNLQFDLRLVALEP